jgi:spermidine synthase
MKSNGATMKNLYLPISVFVSGASILAIEILGTRILGPFYGVSLFLWSALIAITLIALSVGYYLGGSVADKRATYGRLALLLSVSGLWVMIIPVIRGPILTVSQSLGLRTAVFLTAFLLFFPPLTLLGMISPIAIRLRATSLDVVGRSAGVLSSISTLAGVLSALATGIFFVPYLGLTAFTLLIGAALLVTGLVGFVLDKNQKRNKAGSITAVLVVMVLIGVAAMYGEGRGRNSLVEIQSQYAELRVVDREDSRFLLVDGTIHTQVDTSTWQSRLEYVAVMDLPIYTFDRNGAALLVGLGGGSIVKNYVFWNWAVDAVEIDPEIARLAPTYFGLKPNEATIHTMDGRRFLEETTKQYDVILIDAFGSSSIPFHMVTAEAFQLCRNRLTQNGVLAVNVVAIGWNDQIVRSLAATLRTEFTNVVALPIAEPPDKLGNVVLMASNRRLDLKMDVERHYWDREYRYGPKYQRVHAWDNQFSPDPNGAVIVTDDRNPVDVWSEAINYADRKELLAWLKE